MSTFLIRPETKFQLDPTKDKESIDMTLQKWAIFIMGVYGEISHFLSDQAEIFIPDYIKNVDTYHESFS